MSVVRFALLLAAARFAASISTSSSTLEPCLAIDRAFANAAADTQDSHTCKCLIDPLATEPNDDVWIGCTGRSMSTVFSALRSINETRINRVHIWDSILNIVPAEMFEKVRPRILIIERSRMSVVREGTFSQLGSRLTELRLRNNAYKEHIKPSMFKGLDGLQVLDFSGNKLTDIRRGDLDHLVDLRELILNTDEIMNIEDGAFSALTHLRSLSLQHNHISKIKKDTFKGLDNLEELFLHHNDISEIDWTAFRHLKRLKVLDLGRNRISFIDVRSLELLEKLILNNNSIQSLKNVSLKDLPALSMLSLDSNTISRIDDFDLFGLAPSIRLESLSLSSNNITMISDRAFQYVGNLRTLALQNNQMTSLSSGNSPVLRHLKHLEILLLNGNFISALHANELPKTLLTFAASHNHISHVDATTFQGMRLRRLYLNDNKLAFLPKGTFDPLDLNLLEAIDITENAWQCVCEEEWLGAWLDTIGERDVGEGAIGCLAASCGGHKASEERSDSSTWVTATASVLAVVSILILVVIAFLYIEDGRTKMVMSSSFKRVDSDLLKLINDNEAKADIMPVAKPRNDGNRKVVRFAPL